MLPSIPYRLATCLSLGVFLIVVFPGCTSFRTTVLQRFANDSVAPQATNARLRGIPVKLKVPSHLLVTICEEQVILADLDGDGDGDGDGDDEEMQYALVSFSPAQLRVETELQYTDKIFLVDFRRPGGGVLNLKGAEMDEEQYFADLSAEITERTMEDISQALGTLGEAAARYRPGSTNRAIPVSADTPIGEANNAINFQASIVAMKRFDINECGWEQRMQRFIDIHLNRPDLSADPGAFTLQSTDETDLQSSERLAPARPGDSFDSTSGKLIGGPAHSSYR